TLDATIENLLLLKPPINRKTVDGQKETLRSSIKVLLKEDKVLQKDCKQLNAWFIDIEKKEKNRKELKIIDRKDCAIFKKARFFSSVVQHAIGGLTDNEFKKELQEIPQRFSFSASKQGSYVEPILQYVEKSLFGFIIKHQQYIPSKTVKEFVTKCTPPRQMDFSDADLLCLLNFIIQNISLFTIGQSDQTLFHGQYKLNPSDLLKSFKTEARNHNAHGITQLEGRWNDEKLQRLSTLALEVVGCLGDKETFESLVEIKLKLDSELTEHIISTMKRKCEENGNEHHEKRRNTMDIELGELSDFALDIINKLDSSDKQELKQIVRLAVDKNEAFMNIWRSLVTQNNESKKIEKFITLMNFRFDMNLEIKKG
ncbi:20560_t:CDS:2, partial [Entrophospora sp. SA101]